MFLSNEPVEILVGAKVVEVRPYGLSKARVVRTAVAIAPPDALLAAFGDDRTDEDLFRALPSDAVALHVGPGLSRAPIRILDFRAVRELLRHLVDNPPAGR
jgi:trehalose 6-phosphate synthase/phosphatase